MAQLVTNSTSAIQTCYYAGGVYEVTDDGTTTTIRKYYAIAGQTVAMDDGSGLKYLLTDHLGSTVGVTDATGEMLSQQRYLPFGEIRNIGVSITETDRTYTGQRNLPDTGLMDYKARMYDPYLNRWTQPDTIIPDTYNPQDWNRYSYTGNNPINFTDPSGHKACLNELDGDRCEVDDDWIDDRSEPPTNSGGDKGGKHKGKNGIDATNLGQNLIDSYMLGWTNFDSAINAFINSDDILYGKVFSGAYIVAWGGAHIFLAAGIAGLICSAGSACVAAVETALGIGGTLGADGEPTNEVMTLYRAVSSGELDDIMINRIFRGAGDGTSYGGKWFTDSASLASEWGSRFTNWSGKTSYTIGVALPKAVVNQMTYYPNLDRIGPAWFAEEGQVLDLLNNSIINLWH